MKYYIDDKEVDAGTYLYGVDVEVPEIPQEIIMRRVELLRDNLEELLDHSWHTRDANRCNKILKAIDFWEHINDKEK